jgi:DNA-binding XRE family transcriptional regulator
MDNMWLRLGRALRAGRKRAGLTQVGVAQAIGVSRTPIQAIERGDQFDKPTGTMRSYASLVGWTPDSIEVVLAGGEPTYQADIEAGPRPATEGLPVRILEEIGEGRLIDTAVIELPGSNARMTVVVRAPDASPEEIRRDLLAWRRAQRHLQGLGDAGDDEQPDNIADQA